MADLIKTPMDSVAGIMQSGAGGHLWYWADLAGAALVVSGVLLAFIYAWASIFRNPNLTAYVKSELYELLVSALLAIFLIGLAGALASLSIGSFLPPSFIPASVDPSTNVYVAAAGFYGQVGEDMEGWLNMNYVFSMYVDQMASITPYARPLGVGLVASPLAGLASPIKQLLYNLSVALSVAYIINFAQLYTYIFALQAFLNYYLPLGIFFRCFTPTRRLGGTLIGVAAAFLFIFPALSVISFGMFYGAGGPLLSFRDMIVFYLRDQPDFQNQFLSFFSNNFSGGSGGFGPTDLVSGAFGSIGTMLEGLIGKVFLMLLLFPMSMISWAFAVGFVVPAFNVLIFTQAARGLSKSFGEEVDVSSLTRMI